MRDALLLLTLARTHANIIVHRQVAADSGPTAPFQFPNAFKAAFEISSCSAVTVLFIMHFISISLPGLTWFGISSVYLQWRTRGIRGRLCSVCLFIDETWFSLIPRR